MCGIVGAISERHVGNILLEGLKRLEYRGYDSAGLAVLNAAGKLQRLRTVGKVAALEQQVHASEIAGHIGIAHTRWATHGEPSVENAHPHVSNERLAVVHNGIIENYQILRQQLEQQGYRFSSQTDTEVIVHLLDYQLMQQQDLLLAVQKTIAQLQGAYALAIMSQDTPNQLIACRRGSPLIIGVGFEEHFIASDIQALLPVTQRYKILQDGDLAVVGREQVQIYTSAGELVERSTTQSRLNQENLGKGEYRHYMLKEIFEQPEAVVQTLEGRLGDQGVLPGVFGIKEADIFPQVKNIKIVACGTSYYAGCVAKYWIEKLLDIPCSVEIASEFRYRHVAVVPDTLFVTLSQSGETADTLAALEDAKQQNYLATLAICNVPESSLVRASELVLLTHAGPEIGVASTKAFTTQLVALYLLVLCIGQYQKVEQTILQQGAQQLRELPGLLEQVLLLDQPIRQLAEDFIEKHHTLFLGRGTIYPLALEGALKLKEISYIHAEGYPAGELKHGPLALVDDDMPVVAIAPNNDLMDKLRSNLQEVRARGGQLYVFADKQFHITPEPGIKVIEVPSCPVNMAPMVFILPLQLLAYHIAVLRGTDVDQPRNLAKSVTVE